MGEIRSSIILDLQGNLERQAERDANALGRLGARGSRSMQILDRSTTALSNGLDRLGNRYTALMTGAAGAGTARFLINLEERFTMLGIQANVSEEKISALKRQIFDISRTPNIRIDPSELTAAVEDIIEKTGDLKFAQDNLENFATAISATGGKTGSAIGQLSAEFQKMGLTSKKDVAEALDILTVQGKAGAFTLQNLAQLGSRVVTAYTSMGRTGIPAIREMGAALQVIRQGTGSSEMAATAFEALLRTLGDAPKLKLLQKGGIKVFDEEALKKGKEILRPLPALMEEIIRKTGGKKTILSQIFDAEAIRAFNSASTEFQRTGAFASLESFLTVQADGTVILADSERAAHGAGRALQNLDTAWQQFADKSFSGPLQKAADALNSLDPKTVDRWLKIAGIGAGVVGTAVLARKAQDYGRWAMGLFGKGGAADKLAGASKFGDAIPVYVVNGPASIWPGAGGDAAGGASAASKVGKWATVGAVSAPLIGPAMMAGAAAVSEKIGKSLAESEVKATSSASLRALYVRQDVMGGGRNSYQGKLIEAELAKRNEVSGTVKVEIVPPPGWAANAKEITAKNLDLEVDSGRIMRGH